MLGRRVQAVGVRRLQVAAWQLGDERGYERGWELGYDRGVADCPREHK